MQQIVGPLLITLTVQGVISFSAVAIPILLPAFGQDLAVGAVFAGSATAIIYGCAVFTAYASASRVRGFGPIRTCQAALMCVGCGLALCANGSRWGLFLGAMLIGLGYGPVTAASTLLLTRSVDPLAYGFVFSINRVSIPAGAAVAGAALPRLSQLVGWQVALISTAGLATFLAMLLQSMRGLDRSGDGYGLEKGAGSFLGPLRLLFLHPKLRLLSQVSLVFIAAQSCLATFTVAFLVEAMSMSFVAAGNILAVAQVAGVVGRLVLGYVSDKIRHRMTLMGLIGLLIATGSGLVALARPDWPYTGIALVFLIYGAGALGWNGVMLAELAHAAPRERAGEIAGTSSSVAFTGAVVGPILFSLVLTSVGYSGAFSLIAITATLAGVALIRHDSHQV